MEPLQKIPSPPALKWREFRYNFMPAAIFIAACVISVIIWKDRVAMPQMVGQVERIASSVTSGEDGLIIELKAAPFSTVTNGQPVAEIRVADPDSVRASLDAISSDLRVLETRLTQDQQRILQDYERLRLNSFSERVALATAKVELEFAKSELQRVTRLHKDKLVSDNEFEQAQAIASSRQAEVDERTRLLQEIDEGLKHLVPAGMEKVSTSITGSINKAIEAQEEKLRLSRQSVTLRSPIDGIVTEVFHTTGERVQAGDPIMTVTATRSQHIVGYLSQPIVVTPQIGDTVEVRSRADREKVGTATILRVGQVIEPISKKLVLQDSPLKESGLPILISLPDEIGFLPGEVVDLALRAK